MNNAVIVFSEEGRCYTIVPIILAHSHISNSQHRVINQVKKLLTYVNNNV